MVVLPAMAGLVASLRFNLDTMERNATAGFSLATDVADYLVVQGVALREAHEIVGALVAHCEERGIELHEASDEDMASLYAHLTPEVRSAMTLEASLVAKYGRGGTAPIRWRSSAQSLRRLSTPWPRPKFQGRGIVVGTLSFGRHVGSRTPRERARIRR